MRKKRRKKGPGTSGEKVKKMAGLKFQAQRAAFSVAADAVLKYVNGEWAWKRFGSLEECEALSV